MENGDRTHWLYRPGALGDALLTVPLVTQILESHPDHTLVWYQSPWTCELPWAHILPASMASRMAAKSFESAEASKMLAADAMQDIAAALPTGGEVLDIAPLPRKTVSDSVNQLGANRYVWIPATTAEIQEPPHAAQRLAHPDALAPVDLQRAWLVNPVSVFRRIENLALIHVGSGSRKKQMSLQKWVDLAVQRRAAGRRVAYLLGPAELERGFRPMIETLDPGAEILTPPLRALPEVIGAAGEFWGHDSGPSHLAGMMGIPTHVFFGPTNPEVWRPLGPRVTVYRFGK